MVSKVTVHSVDRRHEPPTIFSKSCAKHNKAAVGQGSARKSSGAGRQGVLPNGMAAGPIWPRQARWRGRETDRQAAAPRCGSAGVLPLAILRCRTLSQDHFFGKKTSR